MTRTAISTFINQKHRILSTLSFCDGKNRHFLRCFQSTGGNEFLMRYGSDESEVKRGGETTNREGGEEKEVEGMFQRK